MTKHLPAVSAALIGLIAGAAIMYALTPVAPSPPQGSSAAANLPTGNQPERSPLVVPDDEAKPTAELTAANSRADAAIKERDAARDERATLEAEAARLAEQVTELTKELEVLRAERKEAGFLPVDFGKWREVSGLSGADWGNLGSTYIEMNKLIKTRAEDIRAGRESDPALIEKMGETNRVLVNHLVKIYGDLPSHTDFNGAFTHPANLVNILAAHLEEAGDPLTAAQIAELAALGNQYDTRWDALQAGYDEDTWALRKLVDEADLKEWFHDEMFKVTSPAQKALALPPEIEGLVGLDLYSSGLMLMANVDALRVPDVAGARGRLQSRSAGVFGLEPEALDTSAYIFEEWLAGLGDILTPRPRNEADLYRTHDVIRAGKAQIAALEKLAPLHSTTPETKTDLKRLQRIWLPQVLLE